MNDAEFIVSIMVVLFLGTLLALNIFAANGKNTNKPNCTEDVLKVFNHDVDFKITFNIFKKMYEQKPKLISSAFWSELTIKYYSKEQGQWILRKVGFKTLEDYKKYSKYIGEMELLKEQVKEYNKLKDFAENVIDELVEENKKNNEQN